jgi:hypothetical protein
VCFPYRQKVANYRPSVKLFKMARTSYISFALLMVAVMLFGTVQAQMVDQCMSYYGGLGPEGIQQVSARGRSIQPKTEIISLLACICHAFVLRLSALLWHGGHLCKPLTCLLACLSPAYFLRSQQVPTCKQGLRGFRGCCNEVSQGRVAGGRGSRITLLLTGTDVLQMQADGMASPYYVVLVNCALTDHCNACAAHSCIHLESLTGSHVSYCSLFTHGVCCVLAGQAAGGKGP